MPFIYPPLYYLVADGLGQILGSGMTFLPMRLVSVSSTLATIGLVFVLLGRRESSERNRVLVCALFVAFYGRFEYWYDASRVDTLYVLLLFAALALLIEGDGGCSAAAAGFVAALAAMAKQPALPLFGACALLLAIVWKRRKRAGIAGVTMLITTVGLLAAVGEIRNPWFYYYVWTVPATHPLVAANLGRGLSFVAVTMPLLIIGALLLLRSASAVRTVDRQWTLTLLSSTIIKLALRLKEGASLNFFLPLVSIGLVVAASALREGLLSQRVLLVQFLMLAYNALSAIPKADDWHAGFESLRNDRSGPQAGALRCHGPLERGRRAARDLPDAASVPVLPGPYRPSRRGLLLQRKPHFKAGWALRQRNGRR